MNDETYKFLLKEEGGFVNDPSDSGGATNRGITQATYDAYRIGKQVPTRTVRFCTIAETRTIYDGIFASSSASALPDGLSLMHFDFAANAGNRQAAKILQRTLEVADDGIIGPKTLAAARFVNTKDAIIKYAELRRGFYRMLAEKRPKDMKFLKGWLLRTNRAERAALSQAQTDGIHKQ
jgi:lysozyme family protein